MIAADSRADAPPTAPQTAGRHRRSLVYLAGLALYAGAALWLTGIPGHDVVHQMIDGGPDPQATVFFLKWWPWALLHGHNPFELRQLTWPATYDSAWLTSVAGPAVLGAPVTLLLGPVATWNLWLILAPVTAGLATLVLLETLEVGAVGAIAGGFVVGFSMFTVNEMEGHLFLTLFFPLPLLAALLIRRLRGQIRPAWFVALSILLAAFLLYTSTELFATATVAGLLGLLVLLIFYPKAFVNAGKRLAKELVGIVAGIAVLGAPLLAYALADLKIGNGSFQSPSRYSIDLLDYIVPTPRALVGGSLAGRLVHFTGNGAEQFGYIGIGLALSCVLAMVAGLRRRRWAAPFAIWTLLLAVFALGPELHLASDTTGLLPLPWGLASGIPVLKDALPTRLVVYVFLAVATWGALWTSWAPSRRQRLVRNLALVAGAVLVLPNPGWIHWVRPTTTAAAAGGQLARWVPPHTGLLVVPDWPRYGAAWSEAADFRLAVTERPWGYDPYRPAYSTWPLASLALLSTPPPGTALQLEAFSATHDDGAVAVPDGAPGWLQVLNQLGWRHGRVPGATVYRVPPAVLTDYRHATPAQLHVAFYRREVEALETAGACYLRRGGALATLRPATAAARHCLSRDYLAGTSSTEWTADAGWLGPQDGQVGVGIAASGDLAAQIFAGTPVPQKWLVYDPTAKPVTLAEMVRGPRAAYIAVGPFRTAPSPTHHG